MKSSRSFRAGLKPWMLPIAIVAGLVFHGPIRCLQPLSPILIVVMLYITFCRLQRSDFHVGSYILWLLAAQFGGSVVAYLLLRPVNEFLAQGAMICVICPTATAAPVITGMLGGSVARVAAYSLFSNLGVAIAVPPLLSWINPGADVAFAGTLWRICRTVMPLILLPMLLAVLTEKVAPRVRREVAERQNVSFYIWAVALLIVVGNAVSFVMSEPADCRKVMVGLAAVSLVLCVLQFAVGRVIGRRCGDVISASQSLGQKNTVLAIWIATTYLNPVVSVAPAAYILWHNSINSLQLYLHERRK